MLKLILIFSVLWPQAFLVRRTHFLLVETTIYLFFLLLSSGKQAGTKMFSKKELRMSYMVFLYKSGPIEDP